MIGFGAIKNIHFFYYAGAMAVAFVISYLINFLLGMLAFWFVQPFGLIWIYRSVSVFLQGFMFPLSFYPPLAQKFLFALPFQFLGFVPAQLAQGSYELGSISLHPLLVLVYGLFHAFLLVIVATLLWKFALKKFSGAGI